MPSECEKARQKWWDGLPVGASKNIRWLGTMPVHEREVWPAYEAGWNAHQQHLRELATAPPIDAEKAIAEAERTRLALEVLEVLEKLGALSELIRKVKGEK